MRFFKCESKLALESTLSVRVLPAYTGFLHEWRVRVRLKESGSLSVQPSYSCFEPRYSLLSRL